VPQGALLISPSEMSVPVHCHPIHLTQGALLLNNTTYVIYIYLHCMKLSSYKTEGSHSNVVAD